MKLLLTADTVGGVWTYAMELCNALQTRGVRIALATMGRKLSAEQHRQVNRLRNVQLFESSYRLCWMPDPWDDVELAGAWLLSLADDFRPDVVHLNDLAHGGLDWQAPLLLVGHSCVLSWWEAVKKQPAPENEWARYRSVVQKSVQRATMVAAPSSAMLTVLLRHYGPAQSSGVIYNGRNFPAPMSLSAKTSQTEEVIFAAGRIWDAAKNIKILSHVAGQLPWPVYVAGEQKDATGDRTEVAGVHLLGFLEPDQLTGWLGRSAIFVAPALYEPFGLSILEAARAGCALVLGDIPSLREIWGEAARYFDSGSPESLRRVLAGLIDNPRLLRQMAEQAGRRALLYTNRRMAAEYHRCYRLLVENTGPEKGPDRSLTV